MKAAPVVLATLLLLSAAHAQETLPEAAAPKPLKAEYVIPVSWAMHGFRLRPNGRCMLQLAGSRQRRSLTRSIPTTSRLAAVNAASGCALKDLCGACSRQAVGTSVSLALTCARARALEGGFADRKTGQVCRRDSVLVSSFVSNSKELHY
jgi:hypothetical protein